MLSVFILQRLIENVTRNYIIFVALLFSTSQNRMDLFAHAGFFCPADSFDDPGVAGRSKAFQDQKNCGSKEERFTVVFQQTTDLWMERLRIENGLDWGYCYLPEVLGYTQIPTNMWEQVASSSHMTRLSYAGRLSGELCCSPLWPFQVKSRHLSSNQVTVVDGSEAAVKPTNGPLSFFRGHARASSEIHSADGL